MQQDTYKTKVIFRKFKDEGDIIALFPEESGTHDPFNTCLSYQHIGQHGAAGVDLNGRDFPLATPQEYADLKAELESLGYNLKVCKRMSKKDLEKRIQSVQRSR